jgi:phosphoglycerate dehydrogenase-like enzyme|tara:strand:- start:1959 stop:2879 length:921 start_codon:yes stop_codon:yes gene_type:complete
MKKIISTCERTSTNKDAFESLSKKFGFEYIEVFPTNQGFQAKEMKEAIKDSSICIVGDDSIDSDVINAATKLKHIIKWGSGTDQIDIAAAKSKGIEVTNTPNILGKYVAEFVIGLIINSLRKITSNNEKMKEKIWDKSFGASLYKKVIGFYGYGDIAKNLTKLLEPFDCKIIYSDLEDLKYNNAEYKDIRSLISESEILIISAPLTEKTRGVVNANFLKEATKLDLLINISRGELLIEKEILEMVTNKELNMLCLDVYEEEPPKLNNQLLNNERILFTSHNASNTIDANNEVNKVILNKLNKILGE